MKIRLLSVGKPRDPRLAALHDDYARRLERLGVDYASRWVPDVPAGGRFSPEHAREREARLLEDALDERGKVVALDPGGNPLDSEALARRLQRWCSPQVTFVVGGPLGLHRSLIERSDWQWSLSALTFPHEMVRVLLAEQAYRAVTIVRGTPYHK